MKKILLRIVLTVVLVVVVLAAFIVGSAVIKAREDSKPENILAQAAATISKSAPKMIDDGIRLDGASAMPGLILQYHYTLVGGMGAFQGALHELGLSSSHNDFRDKVCTDPDLSGLMAAGIGIRYVYTTESDTTPT